VPVSQYVAEPDKPHFDIVGTGFLVRPTTAITNRHVVEALRSISKKKRIVADRLLVQFTVPDGAEYVHTLSQIQRWGSVDNPRPLDIGFIDFERSPLAAFEACQPVVLDDPPAFRVGSRVAMVGYAFGTKHLARSVGGKHRMYRFGPVLQQGFISAVAPFDNSPRIDRLLLDIRTGEGMSGSPVFDPDTGVVVGIHDAGKEATTAFAIPLSRAMVDSLLRVHDSTDVERSVVQGLAWWGVSSAA
jgi:hypothetical protein